MLPFAICMNAIPPMIFEKLVVWIWKDSRSNTSWQARKPRGHGLQEMRLSWPPKCRLLEKKCRFKKFADASIQKPDSCARRKPTGPELRIC